MEYMDLVILPSERKLAVHPYRTNIAGLLAKGLTVLKMCLSVSVQSDELN